MGWYIEGSIECPNCKKEKLIIWDRPGECKIGTCMKCGLYIHARPVHIVESSFIVDKLKELSEDEIIDVDDFLFSYEEMEKKNQDIIPKDSEW